MTDQRKRSPARMEAVKDPAPISIEARRRLREFVASKPELQTREFPFTAGETLAHEGGALTTNEAYFIVDGELQEEQVHFVPGKGHVTIAICKLGPTNIACVQAISPHFAGVPSFTTVRALTDGRALILTREGIKALESVGLLLEAEMRIRRQMLQTFVQLRTAYLFDVAAERLAERLFADGLPIPRHPDEIHAWLLTRHRELADAREREATAKAEAQDARTKMREAVVALEDERQRMTSRSLGVEIYLDRVRNALKAYGAPESILDFTDVEKVLLLGEDPGGIDEVRSHLRAQRRFDAIIDLDAVDVNLDELFAGRDSADSLPNVAPGSSLGETVEALLDRDSVPIPLPKPKVGTTVPPREVPKAPPPPTVRSAPTTIPPQSSRRGVSCPSPQKRPPSDPDIEILEEDAGRQTQEWGVSPFYKPPPK